MSAQIDLSDCTLSTEDQAVVDAANQFLALLPEDARCVKLKGVAFWSTIWSVVE